MRTRIAGNLGFALVMVLAIVFSGVAFLIGPAESFMKPEGLCFPAPNQWIENGNISCIVNIALIVGAALGVQLLNRTYNFIANTDTVMGCALMLFCSTNPYISSLLNQSVIIAVMNIVILFILFDCFRIRKSMNELFLVGTLLAITSMFAYGALVFVVGALVMAIMLECLTFRGILALFIGLLAPYIIVLGFGIVNFTDFKLPEIETVFTYDFYSHGHFMLWLNAGMTILILTLCTLYNAVGLYVGNTRRRRLCNCIMMLGWVSVIGMVVDANNMTAYLATLYLALASQLANLFALNQMKSHYTLVVVVSIAYICSFISLLGWY